MKKNPEKCYLDNGYTLLEQYVNCNTRHKCSCLKCETIDMISLRDFKHKGDCKNCKHKLILNEFDTNGCKLISSPSLSGKMEYVCHCGGKSYITWNHFKNGGRCRNCGSEKTKQKCKKKIKIQNNLESYFTEQGCRLLPNQNYINQSQQLSYICVCGTQAVITWKSFKLGHRCPKCAKDKILNRFIPHGENHFRWNPDREQIKLNKQVRNRIRKSLKRTLKYVGKTKTNKTFETLGYTKEELVSHIKNHPNWEAIKDMDWELDHYFPIKAFVEHKIFDEKLINGLDNLSPVTRIENSIKNEKYSIEEFRTWLKDKNITI